MMCGWHKPPTHQGNIILILTDAEAEGLLLATTENGNQSHTSGYENGES